MGIISKKQQYGMRSKYHQVDGKCHKRNNMKVIKFGSCSENNKRSSSSWRIKKVPTLRFKMVVMASPSRLWGKLKNAYIKMMLGVSGKNASGLKDNGKRIPKARKVHPTYTTQEFQDRLIFEIYKNAMASRELASE